MPPTSTKNQAKSTGKGLLIAGGVTLAVSVLIFISLVLWSGSQCTDTQYECGANWLVAFAILPCGIGSLAGIGLLVAGVASHFSRKRP